MYCLPRCWLISFLENLFPCSFSHFESDKRKNGSASQDEYKLNSAFWLLYILSTSLFFVISSQRHIAYHRTNDMF